MVQEFRVGEMLEVRGVIRHDISPLMKETSEQ